MQIQFTYGFKNGCYSMYQVQGIKECKGKYSMIVSV